MKVETWLVVKGNRSLHAYYPPNSPYSGQKKVTNARVVKSTVNKPSLNDDEICFRIELDLDESWFLDGTATIKAVVPDPQPQQAVVQASVDIPVKGRARSAAASVVQRP